MSMFNRNKEDRSARHNVILYGVNSVNLGDDLFFKILFERYPSVNFIMQAPSVYREIFREHKNCTILTNDDINKLCLVRLFKFCKLPESVAIHLYLFFKYKIELYLIIGGSLFMEGNSNMPQLLYKIKRLKLLIPNLKVAILGSNYGPARTDKWKSTVFDSLLVADDICFRDEYSYGLFSDLPTVRIANDIVMHSERLDYKTKRKSVCINLRSVDKWPSLVSGKAQYLEQTRKIIDHFQKLGYSITLLSFCEKYGDEQILDQLYLSLENKRNIDKYYYRGNIDEAISVIKNSEFMLATRFHAIVLGLIYKCRVIPISYSIKSENMLKTLHIWNPIFDYYSFCNSAVEDILSAVIDSYQIDAQKNRQFDYLDKFLN